MNTSEQQVSCKLTTPELRKRKQTVIAELKNLVQEKVETDAGFRYRFDGSDSMLDLLTEFVKTERECCPFFAFTLNIAEDKRHAWLELSGPEGTKDFVRHEIDF